MYVPDTQQSHPPAAADPVPFGAAAEALSGLAEQHRLLVNNADTGLVLADAEGRLLSANPAAERLLGLPLSVMQDRGPMDGRWATVDTLGRPMRPDELPVMQALSGTPVRGAVLGIYRATPDGDGGYVWLEVSCQPLYRSTGEQHPFAVVSSLKDVTDRLKSELELRESEARYRLLADNSSDVIARTSDRGALTWVSPSVRRLLGYSPQVLVGAPAAYLVHPEDLTRAVTAFHSLFDPASDADQTVAIRLRRRGGVYVHTEVVMRAVRSADGRVTEIQSSTRDISSRVEAEEARRSAEDVFRLALEHAPIGMAVIGLDHSWITVNTALARITGHPRQKFTAQSMLDLLHADDRLEVADMMQHLVEGDPVQVVEADPMHHRGEGDPLQDRVEGDPASPQLEVRMLTAAGGYVWIELSTTMVRDSAGAASYFVVQVVDISDRMRAQEKLTRRAATDPLTGLPNRLMLQERFELALARSRRDGSLVGVVFIDLDHFKSINDVFGHDAGDEVLRQLGVRLSASVREVDMAVRLGGDEFVVLCDNCTELSELERLATRLLVELDKPYELAWGQISVSCSVGLTLGSGPDATTLLHEADAAMYQSKQEGRSRVSVFEHGASASRPGERRLENELLRALENGEFRVHYQPIRRLVDGSVHAREALLRWQHPTRGLLRPASFMMAAEASPLICDLGQWMLDQACRDAADWDDGSLVTVNVPPRHLAQHDFTDTVAESLSSTGLSPHRLQIEITETSILQASSSTLASTAALTDLGVTLALDGFGTGYSSITALHRLPITTLKIDRSFVHGLPHEPDAVALVTGMLRMGAGLGLDVVAEGVQNEEQAQWLREQRCPLVQGYHFGRAKAHHPTLPAQR